MRGSTTPAVVAVEVRARSGRTVGAQRLVIPLWQTRRHIDQLLETAQAVAQARPEVDLEMAREVFHEAATLLYNGLALDGLDEHDASAVVAGLCVDLVGQDPGAAVRARSRATLESPEDLHDPESLSRAYPIAAAILQL